MDNLICTDCGTTYYSAAANAMVERGERCDCGGPLKVVGQAEVPVGGPPAKPAAEKRGPRRFARG